MARQRNLEARRMFGAIILATALGSISALWACEHQAYHFGAAAKLGIPSSTLESKIKMLKIKKSRFKSD